MGSIGEIFHKSRVRVACLRELIQGSNSKGSDAVINPRCSVLDYIVQYASLKCSVLV